MSERPTIACYYFPNYHVDPRNEKVHGGGWTEWELVHRAEPRFPGHHQPRIPTWGPQDEADPSVMAQKIAAAADHGIDVFLFDWYWYDDGAFLARGLDEGYMSASNNERVEFALMWANHDWKDIHPAKLGTVRNPPLLYPGGVTEATYDHVVDRVTERYFSHPSYWRVDGCPYFSIYEVSRLVESLGGVERTRDALARLRDKVRAAGFPDLHLNAVVWSVHLLPGETAVKDANQLLHYLGFDSITSYVWVHHGVLKEFPETDYDQARDRYMAYWDEAEATFDLPYFPNVTMGWDPSPRTVQSDVYRNEGYPFTPMLSNNTPERFRAALALAKERLDAYPTKTWVLTLNAWNEWTEGSYLEPDTVHGYGYLEAVRDVFGTADK